MKRNLFETLLNQTQIRLYFPFSDWMYLILNAYIILNVFNVLMHTSYLILTVLKLYRMHSILYAIQLYTLYIMYLSQHNCTHCPWPEYESWRCKTIRFSHTEKYLPNLVNPLMPVGNYSYQFFICCPRDAVSRTANVEGTAWH